MTTFDTRIINGMVYRSSKFSPLNIYIIGEKIAHISGELLDAKENVDASNQFIIPGLIDPHTHFGLDLGWITSCDSFDTGSRAAAYGGISLVIDFLEPASTVEELIFNYNKKIIEASSSHIDVKLHATIKNPRCNLEEFVIKMKELGMNSLKLFTTYSDSGRRTYDNEIKQLLKLSKLYDFLLLAHIEADELIITNEQSHFSELAINRPTFSETKEALKLASFVDETGGYLYMVHCSSGDTLEALIQTYPHLINKHFFIESCPHYFYFTKDVLEQYNGYLYTLAPPLRSGKEQEKLKELEPYIHTFGTDHCPFLAKQKAYPLLKDIPLGIGSIEHSFALMHTLFGDQVIDKMSINIAKLHNIDHLKGKIKVGYDADVTIFQKGDFTIEETHSTCDYDLYLGRNVDVKVTSTMVRGTWVLKNSVYLGGAGRFIIGGESNESNHSCEDL